MANSQKIVRAGILAETAPNANDAWHAQSEQIQADILRILGRSLCIRQVDAGSCNGCELEINALNNPYYNIERLGIKFVASPRHADMLLVTGPVTRNMETALQRAYDATPNPKLVVALGKNFVGVEQGFQATRRLPAERHRLASQCAPFNGAQPSTYLFKPRQANLWAHWGSGRHPSA